MAIDSFWGNKKVLITGNTGFKGSWLSIWLHSMGAHLSGLSLPKDENASLFWDAELERICPTLFGDIRNLGFVRNVIDSTKPEIIFHLAAQSLVREGYANPIDTLLTNSMGTVNLLEAIRLHKRPITLVVITTDKVYQNNDRQEPYIESDKLGGVDPYSASKAACEIFVDCYRKSYFLERDVFIATARAGNVIGGGDWASDRLIPDAIRSWVKDMPVKIRYPLAIRPWQHVLEPLAGYLKLAEKLYLNKNYEKAYNFGPTIEGCITVEEVLKKSWPIFSQNTPKVRFMEFEKSMHHESNRLMLNIDLANADLNYSPRLNIDQSLALTINWYKNALNGANQLKLCLDDVSFFESIG